jgi:hypothetical protein
MWLVGLVGILAAEPFAPYLFSGLRFSHSL